MYMYSTRLYKLYYITTVFDIYYNFQISVFIDTHTLIEETQLVSHSFFKSSNILRFLKNNFISFLHS